MKTLDLIDHLITCRITPEDVEFIDRTLEAENLGRLKKQLGCGSWGGAYLSTTGNVLKFTESGSEASLAIRLKKKKLNVFPHVHRVVDLMLNKKHLCFLIEMEHIGGRLTSQMRKVVREYRLLQLDMRINNPKRAFTVNETERHLESGYEISSEAGKFIDQLITDLKKIEVNTTLCDAQESNFAARDNQLVIIDLGQCFYEELELKQAERVVL